MTKNLTTFHFTQQGEGLVSLRISTVLRCEIFLFIYTLLFIKKDLLQLT